MTIAALTDTLHHHDPDRFGAVLSAPPADRPALLSLYALNLEIARAPFQSAEPMLAEMRLQWWIDRLEAMGQGTPPPVHNVLTPLWDAWGPAAGGLAALAEARRRDCAAVPLADVPAVIDYVADTTGALMWAAASRLGAPETSRAIVADQALGAGLAAWLRAMPALQRASRGLDEATSSDTARLASLACAGLDRAAGARHAIPARCAAALYPGTRIRPLLAGIVAGRIDPREATPEVTPFQRRGSLAWLALTRRWWR